MMLNRDLRCSDTRGDHESIGQLCEKAAQLGGCYELRDGIELLEGCNLVNACERLHMVLAENSGY